MRAVPGGEFAAPEGTEESYEAWMETSGRDGAAAPEGDVGRVVAALQQLPKPMARCWVGLRGMGTAEIMEHLGLSPRTVQRRLERAWGDDTGGVERE